VYLLRRCLLPVQSSTHSQVQTITPLLSFAAARVLSDPEAFISYVGADNKIADPVLEDPSGLNRSRVSIITRGAVILSEMGPAFFCSPFLLWLHKRSLLIIYFFRVQISRFFRLQNNRLTFVSLSYSIEHVGHDKPDFSAE